MLGSTVTWSPTAKPAAEPAIAAERLAAGSHPVAGLQAGQAGPGLHDLPYKLVAQHHRRVHVGGARLPVVDVQIGAADAAHLVAQH